MKEPNFIRVNGKSLILAPMDGVTDFPFRATMEDVFGGWDYYYTDFYRIPSTGRIKKKNLWDFFGMSHDLFKDSIYEQTAFQCLASSKSQIEVVGEILEDSPVKWVDLNLGCPAKKVNQHGGGAYLLDNFAELSETISRFRKSFSKFFTVKMRVGFQDDSKFMNIIKILEDEGVDGIAIHGRTKVQMYKGKADWSYFTKAQEITNLPIIGNGDICSKSDIQDVFSSKTADGVMIGREVLKTPWLAFLYKNPEVLLTYNWKKQKLITFFNTYKKYLEGYGLSDLVVLNRLKFMAQAIFRSLENNEWKIILRADHSEILLEKFEFYLNLINQ